MDKPVVDPEDKPQEVLQLAVEARCPALLVDTCDKSAGPLFDPGAWLYTEVPSGWQPRPSLNPGAVEKLARYIQRHVDDYVLAPLVARPSRAFPTMARASAKGLMPG